MHWNNYLLKEREVFEMSRLENIKYQEIANRLNISVRTVEVRISKALKQLRILLKRFLFTTFFISFPLMNVGFSF